MASQQIVHEVEVQRQHPRYTFPVKIMIGDQMFSATDLSVSGVGINRVDWKQHLGDIAHIGSTVPLELLFKYAGFKFSLFVTGEISNYDKGKRRLGLKFINLSTQELSLLRYSIDAYLGGEVVQAGDLLTVAARQQPSSSQSLPAAALPTSWLGRARHFMRRGVAYGLAGFVMLLLIAAVIESVYEKLFIVQAETAHVAADVTVVSAPAAGQLTLMLAEGATEVNRGSPILGINNGSQTGVTLDSPCDCQIVTLVAKSGSFVDRGQAVVVLTPADTKPYLIAEVKPEQALALKNGARVQVSYASTQSRAAETATVREIRRHNSLWLDSSQGLGSETAIEVVLEPQTALPLSAIGAPLVVRFDTFGDSTLGQLIRSTFAFGS